MTLKSIYKSTLLYPSVVVQVAAIVYSIVKGLFFTGVRTEHTLEWYELVIVNFIMAQFYCGAMWLLSLPIFLNKFGQVSSSVVLTRLSWFLLPFGFIALTVGKAINEWLDVDSHWEIMYATISGLPFIVGLVIGFRKFQVETNRN